MGSAIMASDSCDTSFCRKGSKVHRFKVLFANDIFSTFEEPENPKNLKKPFLNGGVKAN